MEAMLFLSSLAKKNKDPLVQTMHEVYNSESLKRGCWYVEHKADPSEQWLRFYRKTVALPSQGWKLHISASMLSAQAVLRQVLPILLTESVSFKVAASLEHIQSLNEGYAGLSQIGKFITVYPRNDNEAIHLASKLNTLTCELSAPRVPSDRPLRPGSLVHYRYGGFDVHLLVQTPTGMTFPAIRTPKGEIIPDYRLTQYKKPQWAVDPFIAAGIASDLPKTSRFIGERYLIIAKLSMTLNHTIYLASDLKAGHTCVIKGPGYADHETSNEKIRHEANILSQLSPNPHFPRFFDIVEHDGDLFLIMETLEGETLQTRIGRMIIQNGFVPIKQVVAWSCALADALEVIHMKNIVHADVKPSNVIISPDGQVRLIDFDIAPALDKHTIQTRSRGTKGYISPQRHRGLPIAIDDDIYSLGAVLYFIVTGVNPSLAPNPFTLLDRPLEWFHPAGALFKEVITCCLQEQREARYRSMAAIKTVLEALEQDVSQQCIPYEYKQVCNVEIDAQMSYREISRSLLETLCAVAQLSTGETGFFWKSLHSSTNGFVTRDIAAGSGGTLLALAELVAEFPEPHYYEVLARGSQWLSTVAPTNNQPLPGLYVGEAGVGAALLRAGQVLNDNTLIMTSAECGRQIASLPYISPDLYNGTAGRLRFHLLLWDETGEREHLRAAIACGKHLLTVADERGKGEISWKIPAGYESLSGYTYLGYAHGTSGIADALLDLFECTGDEQFLPVIRGAARWLVHQAIPALHDESGLNWPRTEGGPPTAPFWCHGATGIGRFFLHAALCDILPEARDIAARAARTTACCTRWANPTQCHGLAGNIEFLLDMFQATRDLTYLADARSLGKLLTTFSTWQDGFLVFSSEQPDVFTPDYMVGYAGVAISILRLSAPERLPHQLSRAGFQSTRHKRNPTRASRTESFLTRPGKINIE